MIIGSLVVIAALVVGTVAVVAWRHRQETAASGIPTSTSALSGAERVCGFPRLDQITNDGIDPTTLGGLRSVVDNVVTVGDGSVLTFKVRDSSAYVLEWDRKATYTITRYDLASGKVTATIKVALDWDGSSETFSIDQFEVDRDGNIYLLDTLQQRRNLLKLAPDGSRVWSISIPESEFTEGRLQDLYQMALWDTDGQTVIGVQEGARLVHRISEQGTLLDSMVLDGGIVAQLPDERVLVESSSDGAAARSDLWAVDAAGTKSLHVGAVQQQDPPFGVAQMPWFRPTGITTGPDGAGMLVAEWGLGFQWWGDDGVFHGVWPDKRGDLDQPFQLSDETPILRDGSSYYVFTRAENGVALTEISEDRMKYQLGAPVLYNAANESLFGGIGLGAGLVTDSPYNVFTDGREPAVRAIFDQTWAPRTETYQLRYQVRGDPRVWDPVSGPEVIADLPAGGGDIPLQLPATRPGVYEVDAALIDRRSGEPVSGSCLRYTVDPAGGRLDPASLAAGADWGGANPLRGVQLAQQLGVDSHRVQLTFGDLVPDPTAQPDPAGINWNALPHASTDSAGGDQSGGPTTSGDAGEGVEASPFDELARAAALADGTGVRLILQLGSGGEAEHAAVEAGTWEGWVREIVGEIHRRAPQIRYWEPWNEPNGTGFDDGGQYEQQVGAPFARAARGVDPDVTIVGGNSLGIEPGWWSQLVAAGGCASLDVVGIHAYTGYNRSWEEEGLSGQGDALDQLRGAIAPCGSRPVWDTESGWWSDGVANFWSAGSDVARKLLWYRNEGITGWTYFFSEGGFGETGNSWSLLQYGRYVKPAGAAFAATAPVLDRFGSPAVVDTGTPGVNAMRAAAGPGNEGSLLALWTDDLSTSVRVSAGGAPVTLTVRDVYGAEHELSVPAEGVDLAVNGSPALLFEPAGVTLTVQGAEPFGPDVLKGRPVTATSTRDEGPGPEVITSGTFDVGEPWRSGRLADGSVDRQPTVEITMDGPHTLDRIAVATAGIRCCTAGLRDYTVSVRTTDGQWRDVAHQQDQFLDRVAMFRFDPVEATAVRVTVPMTTERDVPVLSANYSGVVGGLHPKFVKLETESNWIAAISAVQAWAPAGT